MKRAILSVVIAAFCLAVAHATTYTSASYVQDGLIAQWDGIDNAGTGVHDPTTNVWKDLKGHNDLTIVAGRGSEWRRGRYRADLCGRPLEARDRRLGVRRGTQGAQTDAYFVRG